VCGGWAPGWQAGDWHSGGVVVGLRLVWRPPTSLVTRLQHDAEPTHGLVVWNGEGGLNQRQWLPGSDDMS
jgi:hypothetical protein